MEWEPHEHTTPYRRMNMISSGKGRHVLDVTASLLTVQLTDGSGAVIGNRNKQKIKESGIKSESWTGRFYSALS
jgi:hypothetical protein